MFFFSLNLQEYFKLRLAQITELKQKGENPYPHKFHVTLSLEDFINKYNDTLPGEILEDVDVSVAGKMRDSRLVLMWEYCRVKGGRIAQKT